MAEYTIKGQVLNIEIREELEPYLDKFERARERDGKLQACSPFRYERNPSFAVNLDSGLWVDSGAETEETRKGNLVSLLSHFRHESIGATIEYLLEKYGHALDEVGLLQLDMSKLLLDNTVAEQSPLEPSKYINDINKFSNYLDSRGIGSDVQKEFNIGATEDAVVFVWHDYKGNIINCKYRHTQTKEFWYTEGGHSIKRHLYAFHRVLDRVEVGTCKRVWITEGETDCLTLWEAGECAVALGTASMSEYQKSLLLKLPADIEIILATDNDTAGVRCAFTMYKELGGYFPLYAPVFPKGYKDINELRGELLTKLIQNIRPCKACNLLG